MAKPVTLLRNRNGHRNGTNGSRNGSNGSRNGNRNGNGSNGGRNGKHSVNSAAQSAQQDKNYITPQGYARLKSELTRLLDVERPELVKVVAWAASNGDRSENGDYLYG